MAKRMAKDVLIVLCLVVLLGIIGSIVIHRTTKHLTEIVEITDSRTEHLRDRVQALEKRLANVEEKMLKQAEAIRK